MSIHIHQSFLKYDTVKILKIQIPETNAVIILKFKQCILPYNNAGEGCETETGGSINLMSSQVQCLPCLVLSIKREKLASLLSYSRGDGYHQEWGVESD